MPYILVRAQPQSPPPSLPHSCPPRFSSLSRLLHILIPSSESWWHGANRNSASHVRSFAGECPRAGRRGLRLGAQHEPINLEVLCAFGAGMIDNVSILKKGNAQSNVAMFARFAPYGP